VADEEQPQSTEQAPPATEVAAEQGEQPAEQEIEWSVIEKALDKVPADQLRKHKRFAGILGGTLQQAQATWEQTRKTEEVRVAREKAEQELVELAQNDPIAFAERFQTQREADLARRQLENMQMDTAKKYMHQIGMSVGNTFNLSAEDVAKIGEELAGKPDDEVLPTFNLAAIKLVTAREAVRMFEEWREKELPKERDALKQELAAERLKGQPAPSIRRSVPPGNVKPHQLPEKEFDAWYERNVLAPARSFNGR
jgi:hypothetical protein